MYMSSAEIFHSEAFLTNSVDSDQTAPVGAVRSGSTLFASVLMLTNNKNFSDVIIFCFKC